MAEDMLSAVGAERTFFANLGADAPAQMFAVLEFTALLRFDLAVLLSDYIAHEFSERAHVYSRFIILTLYESTKKYRELLGGGFQRKLNGFSGLQGFLQNVRAAHKALSSISKEVEGKYGDVRHGIGAHRDTEALEQLERLRGIGGAELLDVVERFLAAIGILERLLRDFAELIATVFAEHFQRMVLHRGEIATIVVNANDNEGCALAINYGQLVWISSDTAVATVDGMGRVSAVGVGSAHISFHDPTDQRISGGVLVLCGSVEEASALDEAWQSLFRKRS